MNAPARLAIFAGALAASLGVGLAVGAAVGPVDSDDRPTPHEVDHDAPVTTSGTTVDVQPSITSAAGSVTPTSEAPDAGAPSTSAVDHSEMDHATTDAP